MKVYALKDNVKKFVRHVPTGYKFDVNGVSDWPDDQFTRRRIRDGDISLEAPKRGQTVTQNPSAIVTQATKEPMPNSHIGRMNRKEEHQKELAKQVAPHERRHTTTS